MSKIDQRIRELFGNVAEVLKAGVSRIIHEEAESARQQTANKLIKALGGQIQVEKTKNGVKATKAKKAKPVKAAPVKKSKGGRAKASEGPTKKERVIDFLKTNGPATRAEILAVLKAPVGVSFFSTLKTRGVLTQKGEQYALKNGAN